MSHRLAQFRKSTDRKASEKRNTAKNARLAILAPLESESATSASPTPKIAVWPVFVRKNGILETTTRCNFCDSPASEASKLVRVSQKLMSCFQCLSPNVNYYEVR